MRLLNLSSYPKKELKKSMRLVSILYVLDSEKAW